MRRFWLILLFVALALCGKSVTNWLVWNDESRIMGRRYLVSYTTNLAMPFAYFGTVTNNTGTNVIWLQLPASNRIAFFQVASIAE